VQQLFHGLSAAPGVGIGNVYCYAPTTQIGEGNASHSSHLGTPAEEWQRFLEARLLVDEELARLGQIGQAAAAEIFLVHREILHDSTLTDAVRAAIDSGSDATRATQLATGELVQLFRGLSDEYFASRATDVRDVGQRLVARLGGITSARQLNTLPSGTILLAEDLTPFDTTHLDQAHVVGIALAASTPTAHTAILARSLGIPLVCSVGPEILQLQNGTFGVVDAIRGRLLVDPDEETLEQYRLTRSRLQRFQAEALSHSHEPALTPDGVRIPVRVNVNSREDLVHGPGRGDARTISTDPLAPATLPGRSPLPLP
jgi:phosphocarrier protein FPr